MEPTITQQVDVVVVGAGPAGLGVAARLGELGELGVTVLDREPQPGGLPAQCEHAGFGLWRYKRLMRGREFADRLVQRAARAGAVLRSATTVLSISEDHEVTAVSPEGLARYRARAIVLATGCRELPRGAQMVGGPRPAGVFNTGVVQRLQTFLHVLPGRQVVLVGSDDMGLIVARSLSKLGAQVRAVVEEHPYRLGYLPNEWLSLGLRRIPLLLGYRVAAISGRDRVAGVQVVACDRDGAPRGKEFFIPCDTVVFSGEFWPESALAREAGVPLDPATRGPLVDQAFQTDAAGIFACGNVTHAADAADHALEDGERTAEAIMRYLKSGLPLESETQEVVAGAGVGVVVPQRLRWYHGDAPRSRLAVRVDTLQRMAILHATAGGQEWGRGIAIVAKPHRSVYLRVSPRAPTREPLVVWTRRA